jgi:hypothetical protein
MVHTDKLEKFRRLGARQKQGPADLTRIGTAAGARQDGRTASTRRSG